MNLGMTIQKLRKQTGIKQKDFAVLCQITPAYLSQVENNQKEPNLSTLRVIADKLAVPLPILLFMSIDSNDIQPEKRAAYEMLEPSIKSLIGGFFSTT